MVKDAEAMKPDMKDLNEMDGPVFKVKNAPVLQESEDFFEKPVWMNCPSCTM